MADHSLPTTTSTYTNVLSILGARIDDASRVQHTAYATSVTNPPTGTIRWNDTSKLWQYNSGTAGSPEWSSLASVYTININGTIGTGAGATPAAGAFTTLSSTSTTTLASGTTVGGSAIVTVAGGQSIAGTTTFSNGTTPIVVSRIGPAVGQQHVLPTVTSDTVALLGATQTLSGKTLSSPTLSGTVAGSVTFSGSLTFSNAITASNIGPTGQQHTIPAVATDTFALLAASQTFTNKTLTSPTINGGTINNASIGATTASTGKFTTLEASTRIGQGASSATTYAGNASQIFSEDASQWASISARAYSTLGNAGGVLVLGRSKSATVGTLTATASGDAIGLVSFEGVNSSSAVSPLAYIITYQDGAPGATNIPGYLSFQTATSSAYPTERMRIDSAGQVGIGITPSAGRSLTVGKNITGATSTFGVVSNGTIQSDVTASYTNFVSAINTQATTFTVPAVIGYSAQQNALGANSAITSQYGFYASNTLTGASNNYGFYGDIAAASGRWNLYMSGTAANYFAGNVGIGVANPSTGWALQVNSASTSYAHFTNTTTGTSTADGSLVGVDSSGNFVLRQRENLPALFYTNDAERMRIDSAGNVGISVTPSAWGSEHAALQIGFSGAIQSYKAGTTAEYINVLSNAYNDNTNWRYIRDGAATRYEQHDSAHKWFTSASGVTGNAITFTQAMTLDSAGNLGIGTSADGGVRLHIKDTNAAVKSEGTAGYGSFYAMGSATNPSYMFFGTGGTETARIAVSSANVMTFSNGSGATERMSISANGEVGIGAASVGGVLEVTRNQNAATIIAFKNSNTGGSSSVILQLASGTKYTNITNNYTSNYLAIQGQGGIVTKYEDFNTHDWRNNAGTTTAVLDTSGNFLARNTIRARTSTGTNGFIGLTAGNASSSGYIEFFSHTGVTRQGYIGGGTSNVAGSDGGTIPYVAATHAFSGAVTITGAASASQFTGPVTALKSATTSVDVSAATAPSNGQVLMATSSTAATWQTVSTSPPKGHIDGLIMSTAGSSATMTIGAGQATDSSGTFLMSLASSLAKTTGSWAVGTATGGLDTGTIAINTWYHFYLIRRPDTGVVDVCFSTSASAPTFGAHISAAYTQYRRIGSGRINSSSQWLAFTQIGDEFIWPTPYNDVNTTIGTTSALYTLTVPTNVSVVVNINANIMHATDGAVYLTSPSATDDIVTTSGRASLIATNAGGTSIDSAGHFSIPSNTSAQIRARANAATTTIRIGTMGWIDPRGRNA